MPQGTLYGHNILDGAKSTTDTSPHACPSKHASTPFDSSSVARAKSAAPVVVATSVQYSKANEDLRECLMKPTSKHDGSAEG